MGDCGSFVYLTGSGDRKPGVIGMLFGEMKRHPGIYQAAVFSMNIRLLEATKDYKLSNIKLVHDSDAIRSSQIRVSTVAEIRKSFENGRALPGLLIPAAFPTRWNIAGSLNAELVVTPLVSAVWITENSMFENCLKFCK